MCIGSCASQTKREKASHHQDAPLLTLRRESISTLASLFCVYFIYLL